MKVLITGGTGLVGKTLQRILIDKGYQVIILTRSEQTSSHPKITYSFWDYEENIIDASLVCTADHIIHLAGTNVAAGKWTKRQKKSILESRVKTAALLYETLENNQHQVKSFISASGSNAYGSFTSKKNLEETDDYGTDFLANVCKQWEQEAFNFKKLGLNVVCLRTGIVLAEKHSALQKMLAPIQIGFGAPLGSGQQMMSFIHIEDLARMYTYVIENHLDGIFNAVSDHLTNQEFTKILAKKLKKPLFLPNVPAFLLQIIFGEMSSILLKGSALNNEKIKNQGFEFKYPNLESILDDLLL